MRVLVTGADEPLRRIVVDALARRGHAARLLSCRAAEEARRWATDVEAWPGSPAEEAGVLGAAEGCGAILQLGPAAEGDEEDGVRWLLAEAERAGVERYVYLSDAIPPPDGGPERLVRGSARRWLLVRPGHVYGPGDGAIALLLKMVRSLPAIPLFGDGDRRFWPLWVGDLGAALARAVEPDAPHGVTLEIVGPEPATVRQVLDQLMALTDQRPALVPVPEWLGRLGGRAADALGGGNPGVPELLCLLAEDERSHVAEPELLSRILGVRPTPLPEGLGLLVGALSESLPTEGRGPLHRQRYWVDLAGAGIGPQTLLDRVREQFYTLPPAPLMRVGVEPKDPGRLELGATVSLAIPLRGHVQVRVEELSPHAITLATVDGHFLAGLIRFMARGLPEDRLRFEIRSYTRPRHLVDQVAMLAGGKLAQRALWVSVCREVARRAGGEIVDGPRWEETRLDAAATEAVERWSEDLVRRGARASGSGGQRGRGDSAA